MGWIVHAAAAAAALLLWPGPEAKAQDLRQRLAVPHGNAVKAAAFSPDGRTILSGGHRESLRLLDAASGKELRVFTGGPQRTKAEDGADTGFVNATAISPDGKLALSAHADGTVRLWDVASGIMIRLLATHKSPAKAVAFSPDGLTVLSGGQDGTMRQVNPANGTLFGVYQSRPIEQVAYAPTGTVGISAGFGEVRFWDLVGVRQLDIASPYAIAVAPDGGFVLVSSVGKPFSVRDSKGLWEVQAYQFAQQTGSIHAYALSPDKRILLMGVGGSLVLWHLAEAREIRRVEGHGKSVIRVLAFAPDGRTVLSGGDDRTLRLWDLAAAAP